MIELILRDAPVATGRPRATVRGGHARVYQPSKTVTAQMRLRELAMRQMREREPFAGPVAMEVAAFFLPPKSTLKRDWGRIRHAGRPDVDNLAKTVLDALEGVLYVRDAQVCLLRMEKLWAWDGVARWEVRVREFSDPAAGVAS